MHLLHIVGARPQFIKLAALHPALARAGHDQRVLHTGQHFDEAMSHAFFSELSLPEPDANLGVHSLSHAAMTARMLEGLDAYVGSERPDAVLVYGDTNSTLAGALVAAKLGIPCGHVEAGLRSGNRAMPEEINRIAADSLADRLYAPTETARQHLEREGLGERTVLAGDVMLDAAKMFGARADETGIRERLGLTADGYFLATVHRAGTTDDAGRLAGVLAALHTLATDFAPVLLPLHPRTRAAIERHGLEVEALRVIEPVSYLEMLALLRGCRAVLTDSGGLQKEAYFSSRVCLTLRDETEWTETLECGANVLCGVDPAEVVAQARNLPSQRSRARFGLPFYGDGDAAEKIAAALPGMQAD